MRVEQMIEVKKWPVERGISMIDIRIESLGKVYLFEWRGIF